MRFAEEFLGVRAWSKQADVMRAVAAQRRVTVRSGHKIGKSTLAAVLALWWVVTKPRARVIITSASGRQVKAVNWKEITRLYNEARIPLGGTLHQAPDAGLQFPDGREVIGFSTDAPERMAGISGPALFYIVDESSGIDERIFEAIEGNRAGGAHVLLLGNPTQTVGTFYESHTTKREFWTTFHISSEETPNVIEGRDVIPGLATRDWIEEKRREWGVGSPLWEMRVAGVFPTQAENQVIGLGLVEAGSRDWREPVREDGPLEIGVDPARYGDDETAIIARRGKYMYRPVVLHSMDTVEVAQKVEQVVVELRARDIVRYGKSAADPNADVEEIRYEKPRVKVDEVGLGAGVVDNLKRSDVLTCVPVNVAESPTDETYYRMRDQLWFAARDWLRDGGRFPDDARLAAELVAPTYHVEARGQLRVESKDDIKKRLKRSPDRADAFALAVYSPPPKRARQGSSYL